MNKSEIRKELLAIRRGFSAEELQTWNRAVAERILASEAYRRASCIMGFLAFGHEISIDIVLEDALTRGKTVAVPVVQSATVIQAARLKGLENLPLDRYGIRTVPEPYEYITPEAFDLLLIPGVGFTPKGDRMGMGAGYYDRFLVGAKGYRLAVTCEALLRSQLPIDAYDQRVQAVVTQQQFIKISPSS